MCAMNSAIRRSLATGLFEGRSLSKMITSYEGINTEGHRYCRWSRETRSGNSTIKITCNAW